MIASENDEERMVNELTKIYTSVRAEGVDTHSIDTFFEVGEFLLAFEGILFMERKNPDAFLGVSNEMTFLKNYFADEIADVILD